MKMKSNAVELSLHLFYSAVIPNSKLDYLMILFRRTTRVKPDTLIHISY